MFKWREAMRVDFDSLLLRWNEIKLQGPPDEKYASITRSHYELAYKSGQRITKRLLSKFAQMSEEAESKQAPAAWIGQIILAWISQEPDRLDTEQREFYNALIFASSESEWEK